MNESLDNILRTLSLIEVKGRLNMSLLLQATLLAEAGNYSDAVTCLDQITVVGKGNIDMALGCIIELEKLAKPEIEETTETKEEVKSDE